MRGFPRLPLRGKTRQAACLREPSAVPLPTIRQGANSPMCGIVGYVGKKSVVPIIIEGLRRLEYRGYDSAGIAVAGDSDGLHLRRAEGKLRNLEEVIRQKPLHGTYGIGHTRWA